MEARNLLPQFLYLLTELEDEPEEVGHLASFSYSGGCSGCSRCQNEVNHSVGGACSTFLLVLINYGQHGWPVDTHPFTVNRYAPKPGRLHLSPLAAESLTLAQIFGSVDNAQAVVAEAYQSIYMGTDEAVLTNSNLLPKNR